MFLPTTHDVWEAVRETYSDMENHAQLYELNTRIWRVPQRHRDVTCYYTELLSIWQELDLLRLKNGKQYGLQTVRIALVLRKMWNEVESLYFSLV